MMIKLHFYKVFTFYLSLLSSLKNGFYFLASCKIKIYNWFYQWWWSVVKAYILTRWGFSCCFRTGLFKCKDGPGRFKMGISLILIRKAIIIFVTKHSKMYSSTTSRFFFEQMYFCFLLALPCYLIPNFAMLNSNLLTFPNYLSTTYNSPEWW